MTKSYGNSVNHLYTLYQINLHIYIATTANYKGNTMSKKHQNKRVLSTIKTNVYEQRSYESRLTTVHSANRAVLDIFGPLLHAISIPTVDLLDYDTMCFIGYPKHRSLRRVKRKNKCK